MRARSANRIGAQRSLGSRVSVVMLRAGFVIAAACVVAAANPRPLRSAAAEPSMTGESAMVFAWTAPPDCPDADAIARRVERRMGSEVAMPPIEITITRDRVGFVALIDARAITVANDIRTLRSKRCDALADAVSVVLARLASELAASRVALQTTTVAMIVPETAFREADGTPEQIVDDVIVAPRKVRWGGGVHVLGLSGVGALPQINLGVELAVNLRRNHAFGEIGISRWVPQNARIAPGAPGGVEVALDTITLRGGWGPRHLPIRAWGLAELGRIQGTGVGLDEERTASVPWTALGAGVGVGWPMSPRAKIVGTFEIAVPLQRPRFMLDQGADIYQPGVAAARCALGLEVGWP